MRRQNDLHAEARWEAGERGCGQLIIGLRRVLARLNAGECLELVTQDAGAPVDIPAWCRITGQELVSINHPTCIIRKQGD